MTSRRRFGTYMSAPTIAKYRPRKSKCRADNFLPLPSAKTVDQLPQSTSPHQNNSKSSLSRNARINSLTWRTTCLWPAVDDVPQHGRRVCAAPTAEWRRGDHAGKIKFYTVALRRTADARTLLCNTSTAAQHLPDYSRYLPPHLY